MIIKQSPKIINKVALLLKRGGVVICPTDTVYGFLADATNKKAVEKIYKIKKRSKLKPLPVFVKDLKMAKELAEISEAQAKTFVKFWPGKYTFILKRKSSSDARRRKGLSDVGRRMLYGVYKKTIALRIPKYPFLNSLLKKINKPLVQTSVNISTHESLKNADDILAIFGKNPLVGLIIDGGSLRKSKPSIIIDFTKGTLTKIR